MTEKCRERSNKRNLQANASEFYEVQKQRRLAF